MANYAQSALLTAQTRLAKKFNTPEMRDKLRPTIKMALQNQQFTLPDAAAQRKSDTRPVETHYLIKKGQGADVNKATRHTSTNYGDSAKITLAWVRFVEKFPFSRKLLQNKIFGSDEIFQHELQQAIFALHNRMETATVSHVFANRCQLASVETNGTGTWDATNKQLVIADADKNYFTQNVKTFMYGRHYRGELDAICDLRLRSQVERVQAQGAGNSTNLQFQFGGVNYMTVTDEIFADNVKGQALVMEKGYLACMPWNDALNRQGFGRPDDYVGMLTTLPDPFGLNMSYDVSVITDRADTTAIGGHIQDIVDQYEISATIGFALPPLSLASDSVIHLIAQG